MINNLQYRLVRGNVKFKKHHTQIHLLVILQTKFQIDSLRDVEEVCVETFSDNGPLNHRARIGARKAHLHKFINMQTNFQIDCP